MTLNLTNDGFDDLTASHKQKKLYFALMKSRGYSSDNAKQILKEKYKLDSFADIDKERMGFVIDRLLEAEKK